jgi:polar amino acid transport system substrate-binding protein
MWGQNNPNHVMKRAALFRILSYLFSFLSVVTLLSSCIPVTAMQPANQDNSGALAGILNTGILVIATDAAYPPQSQLHTDVPRKEKTRCYQTQYTANQLTGFDIDVAVEVANRLGVEPCFVTPTWSQIISGNWGDRWDVNVGSMVITVDRMQKLYFTQPYISGEAVLFVYKDNQKFKKIDDLSGQRIGVCTGCAYEAYLHGTLTIPGERIEYKIKNARIVGYDTDTSALADLAVGDGARLDAVMTDPDTGKDAIRGGMPIKQLPDVVYHDYSAISVDKNSINNPVPLVNKLTEIIQNMHRGGTLLKFSQKYYGGDYTTPAEKFDLDALEQFSKGTP